MAGSQSGLLHLEQLTCGRAGGACLVVEAHAVEDVPDVLGTLGGIGQAAVRRAVLAICKVLHAQNDSV